MEGTGTLTVTFFATNSDFKDVSGGPTATDITNAFNKGYNDARGKWDHLALWPAGTNTTMDVYVTGKAPVMGITLSTGSEGVDFPKGSVVMIVYHLNSGFVLNDIGPITDRVIPKY